MQYRQDRWLGFVLVAILCAAGVVSAQSGAYQTLDRKSLAEELRALKMGTLLERLAGQTNDVDMIVVAKQYQAEQATAAGDLQTRDQLLAEAAKLLETKIETLDGKIEKLREAGNRGRAHDELLVQYFQARIQFATINYITRPEPYVLKIQELREAPQDWETFRGIMDGAGGYVVRLARELQNTIDFIDPMDMQKQIYLVPELADMQETANYEFGIIQYYTAMSLPDPLPEGYQGPSLQQMLQNAKMNVQPYCRDSDWPVQGWACILLARIYNKQQEYKSAEDTLAALEAMPDVQEPMRRELRMVRTKNYTDWASAAIRDGNSGEGEQYFQSALKALEGFTELSVALEGQILADIRGLLLGVHIYTHWADALRTAGQTDAAQQKEAQVEQLYLGFLETHSDPAVRQFVGGLLAPRYEDADYAQLSPVIVFFLGIHEKAKALELGDSYAQTPEEKKPEFDARLQKAGDLLTMVLQSEDESAKILAPDVLWELGVVHVKLGYKPGNNRKGRDLFQQMAQDYPEHPKAFDAAKTAVMISNDLLRIQQESQGAVPPEMRHETIAALLVLLGHWSEEPGVAEYNYDLGLQYMKLTPSAENQQELMDLLAKAAEVLPKVPESSDLYLAAMTQNYLAQAQLVELREEPDTKDVESLVDAMLDFADKLHRKLDEVPAEQKQKLGDWGSQIDFQANILAYEVLDQTDKALERMEKLPERWPATEVLRQSREYAIRVHVEKGDVARAVEQLEQFRDKYGPEAAESLMELVVTKLRETIQDLMAQDEKSPELSRFREAYLNFARQYYKQATTGTVAENTEKEYSAKLLLGDALVQSGNPEDAQKALEMFQQLSAIIETRQDKQKQTITEYFDPFIEKVSSKDLTAADLQKLYTTFQDALKKWDMQDWNSSYRVNIEQGMEVLDESPKDETVLAQTREAFRRGFEALARELRLNVRNDANVVLGLAESHRMLGNYAEAIPLYRQLTAGMDPNEAGPMFWQAQYGLLEASYEAFKDEPENMAKLVVRIKQLEADYPDLGGPRWSGRINAVLFKAQDRAGKA